MELEILSLIDKTFVFPELKVKKCERYPNLDVNFDYLEDIELLKRYIRTFKVIWEDEGYNNFEGDEKRYDEMINECIRRNNFVFAELLFQGRGDLDSNFANHLGIAVEHSNLVTFAYCMLALMRKYTHEPYMGIPSNEFLELAAKNPNPEVLDLAKYVAKFFIRHHAEINEEDSGSDETDYEREDPEINRWYYSDKLNDKFVDYFRLYFSGKSTKATK